MLIELAWMSEYSRCACRCSRPQRRPPFCDHMVLTCLPREIEEQFKKQATFNEGVQRTMRNVPHEIHGLQTDIRALKAKNDKLEGLLNQICKKEGVPATQLKAVRTKRSAT